MDWSYCKDLIDAIICNDCLGNYSYYILYLCYFALKKYLLRSYEKFQVQRIGSRLACNKYRNTYISQCSSINLIYFNKL